MSPVLVNPSRFAVAGGGATYSTAVLADTPLAYYRLNETSGTTINDSSGNSHAGAFVGSLYTLNQTGATTDGDKSVKFDGVPSGTTGYGSIASASWMNITSALTLECWIKAVNSGGTDVSNIGGGGIFGRTSGSSLFGGLLWVSNARQLGALVNVAGSNKGVSLGAALTAGAWTHVACTYDGSNVILYVNGSSVSSVGASGAMVTGTAPLEIATYSQGTYPVQNHYVDECAFYDHALTSTRIAAHYAAA